MKGATELKLRIQRNEPDPYTLADALLFVSKLLHEGYTIEHDGRELVLYDEEGNSTEGADSLYELIHKVEITGDYA